jgi:hypothetical protein
MTTRADLIVRRAAAAAWRRYIGCTKGAANVVLAQSVHILDKVIAFCAACCPLLVCAVAFPGRLASCH